MLAMFILFLTFWQRCTFIINHLLYERIRVQICLMLAAVQIRTIGVERFLDHVRELVEHW